jgi:hypothetical protein
LLPQISLKKQGRGRVLFISGRYSISSYKLGASLLWKKAQKTSRRKKTFFASLVIFFLWSDAGFGYHEYNIFFIKLNFRYIWSQVPCYLYSRMVTAILDGVIQAVEEKKAEWKLGRYSQWWASLCAPVTALQISSYF